MSLERKVGRVVLDLGDLVKGDVTRALAQAKSEGKVSLTDKELKGLVQLLSATVDASFQNGVDGVLRVVKGAQGLGEADGPKAPGAVPVHPSSVSEGGPTYISQVYGVLRAVRGGCRAQVCPVQ